MYQFPEEKYPNLSISSIASKNIIELKVSYSCNSNPSLYQNLLLGSKLWNREFVISGGFGFY
uniref:Uncharacterized protein n=1 Tax=Rhizophagus irregularis (strain DAOM 181602 / DAOM 197198 / MUCL 43194) TaxID=747089 RepID=U9TI66_RHIID